MSMAHMMGERGDSGRSRSRRAAFSQTAGREIWRLCSDDRDLLPDPIKILALSRYLAPPSLSEFSVSVSTGQADRRKMAWQSGGQQSSDDDEHPLNSTSSKCSCMDSGHSRSRSGSDSFDWSCPPLPGQVPVEPTGTSNGRNVQGAMEASPLNKTSTESIGKVKARLTGRCRAAASRTQMMMNIHSPHLHLHLNAPALVRIGF
ncbi:uncharacterized protein [Pseudorasbora parva]|uniref:uncharacterized protein n=1 Tax=Pseudorasbora parva TaxID=51549 RepID=UPI00351E9875